MTAARQIKALTQAVTNYQMINRALEMISVETDFDRAVNGLLEMIGMELHADRCYVCRCTDNGAYCDNTHEWTIRPELAEIQNLQHVPTPPDNWVELLENHKPVIIDDTGNPPGNFRQTIGVLLPQGIKSIFVVGLWENGKWSGFLGVDYVDRHQSFSDSMLQILNDAAKLYDIACERYRNLQEIERKNIELRNRGAMLNLVINSQPAHIFAKNADDHFRYVMANQKFAEFVGLPINEVIGKTDGELFMHSEDRKWFENRDAEIMAGGQSRNFPESAFGADGTQIQFQTVKTPCVGPDGENLLLGISVDITRSANISKSHEIIRQCLETLVLNPNLEAGIGTSIEQVRKHIGADWIYLFHFDFERRCGRFHREFRDKNSCALFDETREIPFSTSFNWIDHFKNDCFLTIPDMQDDAILRKFGSYYAGIIRAEDIRSLYGHRLLIAGKLWGYVGIAFEKRRRILSDDELDFVQSAARFVEIMIQHEQMQSELLRALKDARAAEKAKSYFLATMSHEIRTPLNAVIGFSEILQDGSLPPETQKSYLKDISVAGNALLALINDVLDLSKLEAGQMVFTPVETDFPALVEEVATIFQQRFRDKKLGNIIRLAPMPTLLIDKLRMRQILFNLVGNAVKFTDSGHIEFRGSFTPTGNASGTLRFSLTDTGCGISEEDQKQLFLPFVQANAIRGTQTAQNGTGLGLSIIRRMLDRQNGEISVESTPGKGSTFTVTMRNVGYVVRRHVNAPDLSKQKSAVCNMRGRVLVVDDVAVNLKVTQAMLTKIGVSSVVASGAAEALDCLKQDDITLVLCDLWMPVMNGDELARKIRKLYPGRNLKLVALTADTETGGAFDMNDFNAVLHKPVSIKSFQKLIADFGERGNDD